MWLRTLAYLSAVALWGLAVVPPATHAEATLELRVATMMPARGMLQVKKWARDVEQATGGKLRIRATHRGKFGDEDQILARIRAGALAGAHLSSGTISEFVRQSMILDAPGLFSSQREVAAARQSLQADFDKEAWINGYKVFGWSDLVPTRIFSKRPVRTPQDLAKMRPWQPEGPMARELYALVGARGVPLAFGDLLMGLRTNTVDVVYGSAVSAMFLRWHTQTRYVTKQEFGWAQIAMVLRRDQFEALGPELAGPLVELTERFNKQTAKTLLGDDMKVYERLQQRGLQEVSIDMPAWAKIGLDLRERFVGRLYTSEMLERTKRVLRESR